ncbi:UNVERIFIED_CONTAM: hypothetical protein K2H54_007362 [Gekko kuhli]
MHNICEERGHMFIRRNREEPPAQRISLHTCCDPGFHSRPTPAILSTSCGRAWTPRLMTAPAIHCKGGATAHTGRETAERPHMQTRWPDTATVVLHPAGPDMAGGDLL